MTKLTRKEMQEAVKLGVKEAIHEMCESGDGYSGLIRKEEIFEKIREGVCDAFPFIEKSDIKDIIYAATYDSNRGNLNE